MVNNGDTRIFGGSLADAAQIAETDILHDRRHLLQNDRSALALCGADDAECSPEVGVVEGYDGKMLFICPFKQTLHGDVHCGFPF